MHFDNSGRVVNFSSPTLHMYNKTASSHPRALEALAGRRHAIVVGDSLGDASMATGLPSIEHQLRFGLLNHDVQRLLPAYERLFDVILVDDAPLDPLLALLARIKGM